MAVLEYWLDEVLGDGLGDGSEGDPFQNWVEFSDLNTSHDLATDNDSVILYIVGEYDAGTITSSVLNGWGGDATYYVTITADAGNENNLTTGSNARLFSSIGNSPVLGLYDDHVHVSNIEVESTNGTAGAREGLRLLGDGNTYFLDNVLCTGRMASNYNYVCTLTAVNCIFGSTSGIYCVQNVGATADRGGDWTFHNCGFIGGAGVHELDNFQMYDCWASQSTFIYGSMATGGTLVADDSYLAENGTGITDNGSTFNHNFTGEFGSNHRLASDADMLGQGSGSNDANVSTLDAQGYTRHPTASDVGPLEYESYSAGSELYLTGTIAGTATLSSDTDSGKEIAGGISSTSTLIGDSGSEKVISGIITAASFFTNYSVLKGSELSGDITGASALASPINQTTEVSGTIIGTSTLTGNVALEAVISGIILGQSTLTGDISLNQVLMLVGAIAASTTLNGNVDVGKEIAGEVAATSTLTGDVGLAVSIAGAILGQSSLTGDVSVGQILFLVGAITGSSSLIGDISPTQSLIGDIAATSVLGGGVSLSSTIAGIIIGQSILAGDVSIGEFLTLAGTISSSSSVSGDATSDKIISGDIVALSNLIADTITEHELGGEIASTSILSGEAALNSVISGIIIGQSGISGDITLEIILELVGAITGSSSISNAGLDVEKNLDGMIDGSTSLVADTISGMTISGDVIGTGNMVGDLNLETLLGGTITSTSTLSVVSSLEKGIQGAIAATSGLSGDLAFGFTLSLSGSIASISALTANAEKVIELTGEISGQSSASLSISSEIDVSGEIFGSGSFIGDTGIEVSISGTLSAISNITGALFNYDGNLVNLLNIGYIRIRPLMNNQDIEIQPTIKVNDIEIK